MIYITGPDQLDQVPQLVVSRRPERCRRQILRSNVPDE